ncbi:quinoprotein relay system zinc metallohydrolase 2 [soil metagenome]
MMIGRRGLLTALACAIATPAFPQALQYRIVPEVVADGIWVVRGVDGPIEMANGGAIANVTIIATPAGTVLVDSGTSFRYGTQLKTVVEKLTGKPVVRIYLTHLHPDHIYGAGAFDPATVAATPALIAVLREEGDGFSAGMYRLLGDWMRGTEFHLPGKVLDTDSETFGGRRFRLLSLSGHSRADLAVLDEQTGTLVAGDLVFHDRAPSTPHADLAKWRTSLSTLKALGHKITVPGHGPVDPTPNAAIDQTRDWIDWLEPALRHAVADGRNMVEAGEIPIPPRFATLKSARYELERSVSHFYPGFEAELLPRIDAK